MKPNHKSRGNKRQGKAPIGSNPEAMPRKKEGPGPTKEKKEGRKRRKIRK